MATDAELIAEAVLNVATGLIDPVLAKCVDVSAVKVENGVVDEAAVRAIVGELRRTKPDWFMDWGKLASDDHEAEVAARAAAARDLKFESERDKFGTDRKKLHAHIATAHPPAKSDVKPLPTGIDWEELQRRDPKAYERQRADLKRSIQRI